MKVLLVDDDLDLLSVTAFALQQAGFVVVKASDGIAALEGFDSEKPDIAVLDINMPRMNGFELAEKLRQKSQIPVLMLTVRSEEQDVVRALSLGADDYLTKPFSPKILVARMRALLRRAGVEAEGAMTFGALSLRVDDLTLEGLQSEPIRLTPLEARLLQLLFAHAGRTVPTERILVHVWGNRAGGNRQLLKQLVHRLRQKIEKNPAAPTMLRTVPNAGYVLDATSSAAPTAARTTAEDADDDG
jgi:DNA-binding response OmpR family regulator